VDEQSIGPATDISWLASGRALGRNILLKNTYEPCFEINLSGRQRGLDSVLYNL